MLLAQLTRLLISLQGNGSALEFGARIAQAMQSNTRSWELYTLASAFWRMQGDHETVSLLSREEETGVET
jgi:hypothetical protein